MCGISGITENNVSLINKMVSITEHRGPDDRGIFNASSITLGHSRLSIQDLSYAGHQPMLNSKRNLAIIFNGEIYNFKSLRKELESKIKFSSKSDTEVILNLYDQEGIDGLKKLSGIFAFAIWKTDDESLILVRDKRGIKPLYYTFANNKLIFSSELKALHAVIPGLEIDELALNCFFRMGYITGDHTIWKGIKKLMPGKVLSFKKGQYSIIDFSNEEMSSGYLSLDDAKQEIPRVLKNVVQNQMISDVPVGLFLSGGIDSTLLLSLMSEVVSKPINTFSSFFKVGQNDNEKFNSDSMIAAKTARHFGSVHHEIVIDEKMVLNNIEKVIWHMDEPASNSSLVPNFILAQETSLKNKVVMSGEGGDEIFGGYHRYHSYRLLDYWFRLPKILRKNIIIDNVLKIFSERNRIRANSGGLTDLYLSFAENNEYAVEYFLKDSFNEQLNYYNYINDFLKPFFESPNIFESLVYGEINSWLVDDYLMRVDKMCMAHGLENRVPFLDEKLISLSKTLKPEWKYPITNRSRGKYLLTEVMREFIPDHVLKAPKKGWVSPISKWLRGGLREFVSEVIDKDFIVETQQYIDFEKVQKYGMLILM